MKGPVYSAYMYTYEKSYQNKPAIREDVLVGQNLYSLAVVQFLQ